MQAHFSILQHCTLFADISYSDFCQMLGCLNAREQAYRKHDCLVLAGDAIPFVGIVLSGSVHIVREDIHGNQTVIAQILPGALFGEVFACAGIAHSPVTISAAEDCTVLLFDYRRVITTCKNACVFHQRLTENMLQTVARKTLQLHQTIDVLSQRTLRQKILTYLHYASKGASHFTLPCNREQMANHLCADRSALSSELSKMQREGLLRYERNTFTLLKVSSSSGA